MTETTPSHSQETQVQPVSSRSLAVGFLGPPLVWAVRFLVVYGMVEVYCKSGLLGFEFLGLTGIYIGIGVTTLLSLLLVLGTTWIAYRGWRRSSAGQDRVIDEPMGRSRTLALAGVILGAMFVLVMLIETLPVFFLAPCGWLR